MGGGRQEFLPTTEQDIDGNPGKRTDDINLIKDWQQKHKKHDARYIQTRAELMNVSFFFSLFFFVQTFSCSFFCAETSNNKTSGI